MTKKVNEDFMKSTKCWTCNHAYVKCDVKLRDY